MTYPISAAILNVLFFANEPEGFGRPLAGPPVLPATRAEIVELYKDFEPDLRVVAEVRRAAPAIVTHVVLKDQR